MTGYMLPLLTNLLVPWQVLQLVERRADSLDVVLLDTPGQIEIFTWSASGAIITEAFASSFPTVIAYVVDTPRAVAPPTFMSNMLYACGILYKMRLPLLLTFNKTDVAKHDFALEVSTALFNTVFHWTSTCSGLRCTHIGVLFALQCYVLLYCRAPLVHLTSDFEACSGMWYTHACAVRSTVPCAVN